MSLFNAYMTLSDAYDADIERDVPLARLTSLHVGGEAALLARAHSLHALIRILEVLEKEQVPWAVLGKGTSVLASDAGYRGCVLTLGREFSRVTVDEAAGRLSAGAAVPLSKAVNAAYMSGLSGLEAQVGIPGTVGGALALNAGDRHRWIGEAVESVVCLDPGRGLVRYTADQIEWGYRRCSLPPTQIALEATFLLEPDEKPRIAERANKGLAHRRRTQPTGVLTCGAVFLNPGTQSAGALLEDCGLKGWGVGGASVSPVHANYVVNDGHASANDLLRVIHKMQTKVREVHGVELQPKVKFLGFSD